VLGEDRSKLGIEQQVLCTLLVVLRAPQNDWEAVFGYPDIFSEAKKRNRYVA
jgi:hypothetical protein